MLNALPVWERMHDEVEQLVPGGDPGTLRKGLRALSV
jgi:hypothetical protein